MGSGKRIVAIIALITCSTGLTVGLFLIGLEFKLEWDRVRSSDEMYEQVRPYYSWSTYTHNGIFLGGHSGKLKLALHPFAGYVNLPNQSTEHFSIDSHGFRGPEVSRDKNGKKRLAVIGGSSAFGTGLASDADTFESGLERLLNAEVINAAVIGHQSGQELVVLLTELVDFKPDLVIAFDGFNDWGRSTEFYDVYGVNGFDQLEEQLKESTPTGFHVGTVRTVFRAIFPHSYRWISRYGIMDWVLRRSVEVGSGGLQSDGQRHDSLEVGAQVYANNLAKMRTVSAAYGSKFICVMQPVRSRMDKYLAFRNAAKAELEKEGHTCLDLNEPQLKDVFTPEHFMDDVHLDEFGNARIAEILAKEIQRSRLLN